MARWSPEFIPPLRVPQPVAPLPSLQIEGVADLQERLASDEINPSDDSGDDFEEGDAINVVGSNGKLNLVPKHSTWATPTTYPTELKTVNGTDTVTANASGVVVADSSSGLSSTLTKNTLTVNASSSLVMTVDSTNGLVVRNAGFTVYSRLGDGFFVVQTNSGGNNIAGDSTGFQVFNNSTGKVATIPFALLTQDMTIREIDVCDGGVAKKMLVLASAPYT